MPGVGDQHNNAPSNPFEEIKPRISEYTALQLASLQAGLKKQLGPEYISTRKGPGGKNVHYISSDKVIGLANDIFGFNGWSSSIRDIQVDFVDENTNTRKVDIGLSVTVRVTLRDGTYHEDIGYGHIENCSGKAAAFEKAKKEGTTDALKRTLRSFGNVLGNCVYDKEYLNKVTKIKFQPPTFHEDNLHRHAIFVPTTIQSGGVVKPAQNSTVTSLQAGELNSKALGRSGSAQESGEDEFGSADFDVADFSFAELDHPDEMHIDPPRPEAPTSNNLPPQRPRSPPRPPGPTVNGKPASNPSHNSANVRPQTNHPSANNRPQAPTVNQHLNKPTPAQSRPAAQTSAPRPGQAQQVAGNVAKPNHAQPPPSRPQVPQPQLTRRDEFEDVAPLGIEIPEGHPKGFMSAKAAEPLQNGANAPVMLPQFNPRAESPSIRKTAGIDHTKSMSVKRAHVSAPDIPAPGPTEAGRRLGAPHAMPSPLANRGQFKPVGISGKRPADGPPVQQQSNRSALDDVTAVSINAAKAPASGAPDFKRPRLENDNATPQPASGVK